MDLGDSERADRGRSTRQGVTYEQHSADGVTSVTLKGSGDTVPLEREPALLAAMRDLAGAGDELEAGVMFLADRHRELRRRLAPVIRLDAHDEIPEVGVPQVGLDTGAACSLSVGLLEQVNRVLNLCGVLRSQALEIQQLTNDLEV